MTTPLVPPTPRSQIIGDNAAGPVVMRREYVDYLTRQIFNRLGGTSGLSIEELTATINAALEAVEDAHSVANRASQVAETSLAAVRRVELPQEVWHSVLVRLAKIERRVMALEEHPNL